MSTQFRELIEVMDRLRRECPWTAQQTHESLAPYLLEETHETLEALDAGDTDQLRNELADILLQVVFHARIAAEAPEERRWDINDVMETLSAKLRRRNPHVFGDGTASTVEEVNAAWHKAKEQEKSSEG